MKSEMSETKCPKCGSEHRKHKEKLKKSTPINIELSSEISKQGWLNLCDENSYLRTCLTEIIALYDDEYANWDPGDGYGGGVKHGLNLAARIAKRGLAGE